MKTCLPLIFAALIVSLLTGCGPAGEAGVPDYEARAQKGITSFEECAAAGYAIRRSYPAQCMTPDGRTFIQGRVSPAVDTAKNDTAKKDPADRAVAAAAICKDLCGDSLCQEIVCMAEGCPCAETHETCPQDCH